MPTLNHTNLSPSSTLPVPDVLSQQNGLRKTGEDRNTIEIDASFYYISRTVSSPVSSITFNFSCLLLWGPFHCIIAFPKSRRNMSPRLKLLQETSTCRERERERQRQRQRQTHTHTHTHTRPCWNVRVLGRNQTLLKKSCSFLRVILNNLLGVQYLTSWFFQGPRPCNRET